MRSAEYFLVPTTRIETNYIELWTKQYAEQVTVWALYHIYTAATRASWIEKDWATIIGRRLGYKGRFTYDGNNGFVTLWI